MPQGSSGRSGPISAGAVPLATMGMRHLLFARSVQLAVLTVPQLQSVQAARLSLESTITSQVDSVSKPVLLPPSGVQLLSAPAALLPASPAPAQPLPVLPAWPPTCCTSVRPPAVLPVRLASSTVVQRLVFNVPSTVQLALPWMSANPAKVSVASATTKVAPVASLVVLLPSTRTPQASNALAAT